MIRSLIAILLLQSLGAQQPKEYIVRSILFYNVENLFDTINDPLTLDDDRTPEGKYRWTKERYETKLDRIAKVVEDFKINGMSAIPDLIGLCEIENVFVLQDLVNHSRMRPMGFEIIHHDSPDKRGIDVAMLYRGDSFMPVAFQKHHLKIRNENFYTESTRDQLVVKGFLDEEEVYLIIVHWPSRRGGTQISNPRRIAAAQLTRKILDSINRLGQDSNIIIMGDFNDNPTDISVRKGITNYRRTHTADSALFYNPMEILYRKGLGSLAYRDQWSLFDQIIISEKLRSGSKGNYRFWKAGIVYKNYLMTRNGRYKGYPLRTYAGGTYTGGFSDHLPVYLLLIKELEKDHLMERK